jgi:hypothetical protein
MSKDKSISMAQAAKATSQPGWAENIARRAEAKAAGQQKGGKR